MEGLKYFYLLILYSFIINLNIHKFIKASGGNETTASEPISETEKNILEESNVLCDPKRPNIFVDRNNLLGKNHPEKQNYKLAEFTYGNGPNGPAHWAKIYKQCGGKHQSPIDIDLSTLKNVHMQKLTWDSVYSQMPEMITVSNNGRTVVIKPKYATGKQAGIQGGPLSAMYILDHIHFHWGSSDHKGSEHTINGKSFPMEMHAVHLKEHLTLEQAAKVSDGIAIVGYFFEIESHCHKAIQYIQQVFGLATLDVGLDVPLTNLFPLRNLAEEFGPGYVTYNGSLTEPPCTEHVIWILSPFYVGITVNQLKNFRKLYDSSKGLVNNFRPLQPNNNRTVVFVV
ncbi:carbonic anhydrase 3-like isoform X2 [Onthophagus taurus]|uniref:carbonic anhydrase 3-like isoform X2 n=1 Tax=Onthophagus taurus TaxID=166361 RepID=UPI000C205820|nr:carbonic anhydrase 3-like [Onthophagus taurus]